MLVGTSLGAGEDAVVGRARDDFEEPEDGRARPRADVAIGRQRIKRGQPCQIDREIGGRIELGHLPRLEMIEPGAHASEPHAGLPAAHPARAPEARVGKQSAGNISGGVEEERVVLGEVPLHVIARLIHPVAVAENRAIDAG